MLMIFLISALWYAYNDLTITSEGPNHQSKNSETAVQWCSLKYDHTLKLHPQSKYIILMMLDINYGNLENALSKRLQDKQIY